MVNAPCISAVIVTYESALTIKQCLESLYSTSLDLIKDCIIVDNASQDDTLKILTENFPQVKILPQAENLGFGKAVNIGVSNSSSEYLLFLNPDTVLKDQALRNLLVFIDSRPSASACGPKILDAAGNFRFDSRRGFPTPLNSLGRYSGLDKLFPKSKLGTYWNRTLNPDKEALTDVLSGSCILIKRDKFLEVGGFDEDYFLFGEDIDLCWKLKKKGGEIWYVPQSEIIHLKSQSMKKNNVIAEREFYRSMHIYIDKRLSNNYSLFSSSVFKFFINFRWFLGRIFSSFSKFS